ncbi:30S ribosomal protein S18 [Streptomyces sp. NPDC048442]|uniref:30S ribosomal protein S18 n=1 Tax=Streptomyces sp. NPDC048442 TaxID=3154823 RepID=UPI0034351659
MSGREPTKPRVLRPNRRGVPARGRLVAGPTTRRKSLSDRAKIRSRRFTRATAQQQRQIAAAIKNARELALLPYAGR